MKIDIDPEQFASAISQAVLSALQQNQFDKPVAHPILNKYKSEQPIVEITPPINEIKRKRGRPRKDIDSSAQTALVESTNDILGYKPPEDQLTPGKRAIANTVAAKRTQVTGRVEAKSRDLIDPNRKIKFTDDKSVARDDPRMYANMPERNPREAVNKIKLNCNFCHRDFEVYPSEYPQAFEKQKDPMTGVIETALVRCERCYGR